MPMTAHDYKERYRSMDVPIVNDKDERTGWQRVDVHQYLLANDRDPPAEDYNISHATHGLDELQGKIKDHFQKAGATLKVFVGAGDEKVFNNYLALWYYAKKAYWGKGSPEEVQITLQLVMRFGMSTAANLQVYCDTRTDGLAQGRIGLDCNGFVGNFIEHGHLGKAWDKEAAGFEDYKANTGIQDIMSTLGPEVESLKDIQLLSTYVMGLVDGTGQVINRFAAGSTGHIVVSTPFTVIREFSFLVDLPRIIVMKVVESTPNAGLTESDYFLISGANKVFEVSRGSTGGTMKVRMRPLL